MTRPRSFPSGLALDGRKSAPLRHPIRPAPPPAVAVVPLATGDGREAEPAVSAGDRVAVGTRVGLDAGDAGLDVHSPVAGRVLAVEQRELPGTAATGTCVVIENDGSEATETPLEPLAWERTPPEALLQRMRTAGVVGLGGAAFPTAVKLASGLRREVGHLVLNGAECEPWICCDDALMRERADAVVSGARVMLRACGAGRCTIAIEDDKPEAIASIEAAVARAGDARIEVRTLPAVYPAGAERQLLATVAGVEVPHDSWPTAAGLLCQNVGTAAAVAAAVIDGEPLTRRIVTVTGSGVREPANLEARIGTPIADLVAACGGYAGEPLRLIAGGSMTGRALPSDAIPVTQGLNCVVVATAADLVPRAAEAPCIRCGDCAEVCPAGLLPQSLLRAVAAGDRAGLERYGLADCIECGCCDYVCPSAIPLTARFTAARREHRERLDAERRAATARERWLRHEHRRIEAAEAERLAFEEARRRARGQDGR